MLGEAGVGAVGASTRRLLGEKALRVARGGARSGERGFVSERLCGRALSEVRFSAGGG